MPATYRLLRDLGFEGVAMTDSLDVVRGHAEEWAVAAARAGADLLLFTSGKDAARAIRVLVPLARRGELDEHVRRVLRFRALFRLGEPARVATNAATSRIFCALSCPANAGIPPPPFFTFASTTCRSRDAGRRGSDRSCPCSGGFQRVARCTPGLSKDALPAAACASAGMTTAAPDAAAGVSRVYSQTALVYQTPIRTANRIPPAIGSTGTGKRRSRTIVIFAAYAP